VPAALAAWRAGRASVWLDAESPAAPELEGLERALGLRELPAFSAAGASAFPRPRLRHAGAHTILRLYVPNPGPPGSASPQEAPDRPAPGGTTPLAPLYLLFGERFLLTLHERPLPLIDRRAAEAQGAAGKQDRLAAWGVTALLHDLLQDLLDAYDDVLDLLGEEAVNQEAATYGSGPQARRALLRLVIVRRDLFALRRIATAQRSALTLLARDPDLHPLPLPLPAPPSGPEGTGGAPRAGGRDEQLSFANVLDHAVRLEQAVATQHDLLVGARTAYHTWVATGVAQATRTLLVAICLVSLPTLVFAVYGMNFDTLPELRWPVAHLWAVLLALALDGALWLAFRRQGWV
jgi:magnesium transporter